jgi:hypothetical protein
MEVESVAVRPGQWTWGRVAVRCFACSCFFPYPALAIGGSNGLQLSQALALAAVPLLCATETGRPLRALLLVLTPIYLSALVNTMRDRIPSVDFLPKESAALTLALIILWPAGWLMRRELLGDVLMAACAAIVVHALIGLYQVRAFAHDDFPLLFLYRNPSFKSMEQWSRIYAVYIKRPCGLFPEPSAMAASLGAWLVLLAGLLIDPCETTTLGWRRGPAAAVALAGGLMLVGLSRSGSTFAILGSIVAVGVAKLWRGPRPLGAGKLVMTSVVLLGSLVVAVLAAARLMDHGLGDRVSSSWGFRGLSIAAGLSSNTDPISLVIGVGPGQSTPIIRQQLAGVSLPPDQDELAIFSLAVCYYMETGLVGALALLAVLAMVVRTIAHSSAVLLGFSALCTWLVGVAATTSYMPLSAIWLFLGAMLRWDRLFPPPAGPVLGAGLRS